MNFEPINKLVSLWYSIIQIDHHKDKDCHFEVTNHFSYNGQQQWRLQHWGYLLPEVDSVYNTDVEAYQALDTLLRDAISNEIKSQSEDEFLVGKVDFADLYVQLATIPPFEPDN